MSSHSRIIRNAASGAAGDSIGGEGGIRTRGPGCPGQLLSRQPCSTTPAPLRFRKRYCTSGFLDCKAGGSSPRPKRIKEPRPPATRITTAPARSKSCKIVNRQTGGMAEWSKAPVLKTGEASVSVGSNPTPSASNSACRHRMAAGGITNNEHRPGGGLCAKDSRIDPAQPGGFAPSRNRAPGRPSDFLCDRNLNSQTRGDSTVSRLMSSDDAGNRWVGAVLNGVEVSTLVSIRQTTRGRI